MKPIEPGCLCLVISGPDINTEVTAKYYCLPGFEFTNEYGEEMVTTGRAWVTVEPDGEEGIRDADSLIRIDGNDTETTEEKNEVAA